MSFTEEFIQVGGDSIYYVHGGAVGLRGALPLVLVHGLSGATTWWARNLEQLGEHGEVYALDLPGFGRTRSRSSFDLDDEVTALAAWASAVKVRRAIFVGHSLGGYLAAHLAMRTELVAGLVLVDAAIFPPDYGWWRLTLGLLLAPFTVSLSLWPVILAGVRNAGFSTVLRATGALLEGRLWRILPAVRAPTLMIWGRHDTVVPPSLAERMKGRMTNQPTGPVLLRGGHAPMWDDSRAFGEVVRRFSTGLSE